MTEEETAINIIENIPYKRPFFFIDKITDINQNSIIGDYYFRKEEFFYKGHFKKKPVTPGVILVETMGQIGLVAFGIYLLDLYGRDFEPLLFNIKSDFHKIVYPETRVFVFSEKVFYRAGILKCNIKMADVNHDLIATTTASCQFKVEK